MAKEREVNILIDAKNKSKGAFLEVKKDLRSVGDESEKGLGRLSNSFANADKVIFSFADKMGWMDKIAKRTFQGTAAAASLYIGATLRDFSQLNDGISKVNTLYDQTGESQRKMYQDSMKMFKMLPTNFERITQSINDTISSGADPKDAAMMARKFGMAGTAGEADMEVVTKAAMGTMNAYKLEAQDLTKILDLQFMTVKDGIVSYSELASSLGTGVLANAKSSGITLEELYGSIAMITKNAIPANIATTSLNQLFNKFTNTKAIKEFDTFGVKIQDAKKNTRPLIEILKDLNMQFDKRKMTSESRKGYLKELLGSDEAARAILPLLGDLKDFQDILGNMDNSSGSMRGAYDDRLDSIKTQVAILWNNLKGLGIEQIYTLDPLMKTIMEPTLKRQKLELDIAELEEAMEFEKDPMMKEMYLEVIAEVQANLDKIEMAPVDQLRDALAQSVKELERLNPPLAKFLDTIGGFVLNFVGDEGAENREKAGSKVETVAKTVMGVYVAKKAIDATGWMMKNFKWVGKAIPAGLKLGKGALETTYLKSLYAKDALMNTKNAKAGLYIPEEYKVGGPKYNDLYNQMLGLGQSKEANKSNLGNGMDLYSFKGNQGLNLMPIEVLNTTIKEMNSTLNKQQEPAIKMLNTSLTDELLKMWQIDKKIDNNINMSNHINVEAPRVDTRVYIDGKNIPVQRVEVDYKKIDKHSEVQARRYGKPQAMLY